MHGYMVTLELMYRWHGPWIRSIDGGALKPRIVLTVMARINNHC